MQGEVRNLKLGKYLQSWSAGGARVLISCHQAPPSFKFGKISSTAKAGKGRLWKMMKVCLEMMRDTDIDNL